MTTMNYKTSNPYAGNRPYADVKLNPSRPGVATLKCLVDTGADFLMVNESDATAAGLPVASATPYSASVGGGTASLLILPNVKVTIEGSKVLTVELLMDPKNRTKPVLAGRQLLMAAFDVGFDASQWLST